MSRRKIEQLTSSSITNEPNSTTYQVWLTTEQQESVTAAYESFDGGWAQWVSLAIDRLMRESEQELKSIIGDIRRESRAGKSQQSFRMYESSLADAKALAKQFDSNIQTVLATAFFMQSLAPIDISYSADALSHAS